MTGPERVSRSDTRFSPFPHVVVDPYSSPPDVRFPKKKNDAPQPPRPQNAWILYRAWALNNLFERQPELKGTPQSQLSKILGNQWANETPEIRKHFEHQANLNKERHARAYPNYVFRPQKKDEKEREREKKKQEKAREREAAKLMKEIERNMNAGVLPKVMMSKPTVEVLEGLAYIKFVDLGPSPPISQCPSPVIEDETLGDESEVTETQELCPSSSPDVNASDGSASMEPPPGFSASGSPSNACTSDADQQSVSMSSVATPPQTDNAMALDTLPQSSLSSDDPPEWSKFGVNGIEEFFNKLFPPDPPGPEQNRFDMPSGNIVLSPGFVDGAPRSDDIDASGIISIPIDKSTGIFDDQYDCDVTNPLAEQPASSSSSSHDSYRQESNEALFMQPFVQLDVPLEHLLAAGNEVGEALLDEREACANGERVIAAEHVQDGPPAMSVEKTSASSSLPSPPESSSSITSPLGPGLFDFSSATNLCASGSNQDVFGGLGFSDPMSNTDLVSPPWCMPSFGDLGKQESFGFGSCNKDTSVPMSTNTGEDLPGCESCFPPGFLSDVPPTPDSAGPWKGGSFEIGEIAVADFSSLNAASASIDDAQRQKEDDWFAAYFNDQGLGAA